MIGYWDGYCGGFNPLLHDDVTALCRTFVKPFLPRMVQTSRPERTRSLPNLNLDLSYENLRVLPRFDFRRLRGLKKKLDCFLQIGACILDAIALARDIELGTQGDISATLSLDNCRELPNVLHIRISILEQRGLAPIRRDAEMIVRELRGDASARRAVEKPDLHEERLVDFFDGVRFLGQHGGQRIHPDRAALIFLDDREQQTTVDFVEAVLIDFQHFERGFGRRSVNLAGSAHLGVVANAAQEAIGNAGRAARAAGAAQCRSGPARVRKSVLRAWLRRQR